MPDHRELTQAEFERLEGQIRELRAGLALLLSWVKNWDVPFLGDDQWREMDGPMIEALLEKTP